MFQFKQLEGNKILIKNSSLICQYMQNKLQQFRNKYFELHENECIKENVYIRCKS